MNSKALSEDTAELMRRKIAVMIDAMQHTSCTWNCYKELNDAYAGLVEAWRTASQFKSKDNIPEPDNQDELWAKIIFDARHYNGTPHDLQALTEHFKRYYRLNEL